MAKKIFFSILSGFQLEKKGQTTIINVYIKPFKAWLWQGYHLKAYGVIFSYQNLNFFFLIWVIVTHFAGSGHI